MPKSSVLETQGVTEYGTVGTTKGDGVVSIDLADDGTIIDGLGTVIDGLGTATVDVTLADVTLADVTLADGLGTVLFIFNKT